jgi:hypothetical protein
MAVDFFVCLEIHVECKVSLDRKPSELWSRWQRFAQMSLDPLGSAWIQVVSLGFCEW